MVNVGVSKGCNTCKARKIKCDQGKPGCRHCLRSGRECGGYEKKARPLRFKAVQPAHFATKPTSPSSSSSSSASAASSSSELAYSETTRAIFRRQQHPSITPSPRPSKDAIALPFLISNFASPGLNRTSTQNFHEIMLPLLTTQPRTSPLVLALTIYSVRVIRSWYHDPGGFYTSGSALSQAYRRLNEAIQDPVESKSEATLLTVLVLQWYENVSALYGARRATRAHLEGAVALIKHQGLDKHDTIYSGHLIAYVLKREVIAAVRERRPLPHDLFSWLNFDTMLLNPYTWLDTIGIDIANLQHKFEQLLLQKTSSSQPMSKRKIEHVRLGTSKVITQCAAWLRAVPDDWLPISTRYKPDCTPPLVIYSDTYNLYPSIPVAEMWNRWRCYRLILFKIALTLEQEEPGSISTADLQGLDEAKKNSTSTNAGSAVQDIVDSICSSVTFHLGNRHRPAHCQDLSDPSIILPNYHDLSDELPEDFQTRDTIMSEHEHHIHVTCLGPWNIVNPLSHVLSLCSGPHGSALANCLRPGQLEWIRGQLLRTSTLLLLDPVLLLRSIDFHQEAVPPNISNVEVGMDALTLGHDGSDSGPAQRISEAETEDDFNLRGLGGTLLEMRGDG